MKKTIFKPIMSIALALCLTCGAYAQNIAPKKDEKKNLWGYVDNSTGKWVVKPKYDSAAEYTAQPNGKKRALVARDGKQGFLDENGKALGAGIVFEKIEPLEGDAMFVTVKGKKGVANYDGVYLIKPEAESVEQLGTEGWIVSVKGKKGLLKYNGSYLIEPVYNDIDTSLAEYFIVTSGGKAGLLKRDGSVIVMPKDFTGLKPFKDNYWSVKKGNKEGVLNIQTGAIVLKPEYDNVEDIFLNGKVFIVKKGNKLDVINANGKRKFRFNGLEKLNLRESSNKDALLMMNFAGKAYIYTSAYDVVNPVDFSQIDFHGFTKTTCKLLGNVYYTEKDKRALAPFTDESGYFTSPYGKTRYFHGTDISKKLFCMFSNKTNADLFKVGEYIPIGTISADQLKTDNRAGYKLTTGEYIDLNGDPMTVITFNGKNVMINNPKTGKYMLVNNDLQLMDHTEYDMAKPINSGDSYRYLVKVGNRSSLLSASGEVISNADAKGMLTIGEISGYTMIIDQNQRLGLKDGDVTVIPPLYDDISMLELYDRDDKTRHYTSLFKVSKDGKTGLYDISKKKMVIPIEKGYSSVGGREKNWSLGKRLYDSDLCYVQTGEETGDNAALGIWNMKLGKEVLAPAKGNKIQELPKGYKGYESKGIAYTPSGTKMTLKPMIDVYQSEWANHAPYFFIKIAGLQGRTIEFQITAYKNGAVYKNRFGEKCIYTFSQTATPESVIEYGPTVTAYLGNDIYLPPYSTLTLKFVLTAKDAKTGAAIPVQGEKSVTAWWERGR